MPVAVYIHPKGLTLEQYFEVHRLLNAEAAGYGEGRLHHSCFGEDGDLMVYDIYESAEAFQAFGDVLLPVLAKVGVDMGEPAVMPVHGLDQAAAQHGL
ncbi:MAG TPA: hypothetical protein VG708_11010 [Mycobacteriales bacterium]|nr:hypothetical protein [Mycobacteriales bacterium]